MNLPGRRPHRSSCFWLFSQVPASGPGRSTRALAAVLGIGLAGAPLCARAEATGEPQRDLPSVASGMQRGGGRPFWIDGPRRTAPGLPDSLAGLSRRLASSVIAIAVDRLEAGGPQRERGPQLREVLGSGVLLSADGYALTVNSLVADASRIRVQLPSGRRVQAELVGRDTYSRLALLKLPVDEPLTPAALGDSERAAIGDWVIALAHIDEPGWDTESGADRQPSLAKGIVSGQGRQVEGAAIPMLQTDLTPVRGYAGAPLADMNGQVIGLVDPGLRPDGSFGISFAIPINEARRVLAQLRDAGEVKHGWLGVQVQPLTSVLALRFGAQAGHGGALVSDVLADTPAARASIEPGDVIVEFDGHPIDQSRELSAAVSQLTPGTTVDVVVLRKGERQTLAAVLGSAPERAVPAAARPAVDVSQDRWGFDAEEWSPELAERFGLTEQGAGLVVTAVEPFSAAERAELAPGDILREANGEPLATRTDLEIALATSEPLLRVQRGRTTLYRVLQRLTP